MDALNKMSWCWAVLALVSALRSFMPVSALDCQPSSCGQLPIHPLLDACTSASFRNSLKCINNTLSLTLPSGSYKVLTVHYSNQTLLLENPLTNQQNSCCYSNSLGNLVVINSSSPLHVPNYSGSGGSFSQTQSVRVCPFEADGTDFRVAHSVCIPEYQHCPAAIAGSAPNPPSRCISPHDGGPQAPDLTSYKSYLATWVNLSSANFSLSWSSSSSNCSSVNCAASCRLHCNGQPDCDGQKAQINCSKACGLKCKTKRTSKILLIGIAVGAVGIAGLSILAVICVCRPELHFWKIFRAEKGSLRNIDFSQYFSSKMGSPSTTTLFSYKELKLATRSFAESRLLGDGGFGTVYEGRLTDGRVVAVKKLNKYNKHGLQQFYNEVTILSQVRHINLVQLLGCCLEGAELMLVYEFVPNGTLADHIHGHKGNHLGWEIRLMIAVETAQALAYLHYLVDPPILHRDVKSSNILLDEKFRVKVADFGLSRLMMPDNANHISSAPQGTPGYLDPDYYESYQLTDKSDVYSFGVVLMELISAQRAVDMSRERKEINLASMALSKIQCGALEDLADPELEIQQRPAVREQLSRVAELAFRCLASQKDDRPSMREVAQELQSIRETQSIIQLCECNSLQCKEANTIETCTEKHTESGSSIHNLISKVSSHNNEVEA